jgi:DNA polymerase-3 subunit delta'
VHHAYRFEGPDGVGKEMAAFALAQALVCTAGATLGCGGCEACRRAVTFSPDPPRAPLHPDVAVIERGFYPPETIGRARQEISEISVDQVRRVVLAHAAYASHGGRARVFIVRRAEELSISAANAMLKTLEEPRPGTHFVLLSAKADRLLDTIRSRTLPVRFGPLPDDVLRGILRAQKVPEERQDLAIELAGGSASAALEHAGAEEAGGRDQFVAAVLAAVQAPDLGRAVALAESRDKDKNELRLDLAALGAALARAARGDVEASPARAALAAHRYDAVARALTRLERNASPSLTLVSLLADLRAGNPVVNFRFVPGR